MLDRLERIEALDHSGASPAEILEELRALLAEAETWSRKEGGPTAARAVEELRSTLGGLGPSRQALLARDMIAM